MLLAEPGFGTEIHEMRRAQLRAHGEDGEPPPLIWGAGELREAPPDVASLSPSRKQAQAVQTEQELFRLSDPAAPAAPPPRPSRTKQTSTVDLPGRESTVAGVQTDSLRRSNSAAQTAGGLTAEGETQTGQVVPPGYAAVQTELSVPPRQQMARQMSTGGAGPDDVGGAEVGVQTLAI